MAKYSLGLDFGTESARVILVEVTTGEEVATSVYNYPDGVIDRVLPEVGTELGYDWALQNPKDYIESLGNAVPEVMRKTGASPEDIVGIGLDFTSCTMMPIDKDGKPLCMLEEYKSNPHSWVKLWKHHAAQPEADRINKLARERGEEFLGRYGGRISSEWFFPKILQILDEAPEIYDATDRFIEGADWMVMQLTGVEKRSACTTGYKAFWEKGAGFPSNDFFKALHPKMEHVIDEKMKRDEIYLVGTTAGGLTPEMARFTGLKEGTPVGVGIIDAHSAVPGTGVADPGKMVMVMGTSTCHMLLSRERSLVAGIGGVVEDGIIPGFFGYEAGQSAVGDIFAWFVKNCIPGDYQDEARSRNIDIHSLLEEKASRLKPGGSGLIALDWWNGNRSVLMNANLTGLLLGCTLGTRPEEIYRALIEATAFGTNRIIVAFEKTGVEINELYACAGLTKNKLLMQIYADITGREIKVAASEQATALGAAILGAVVAGSSGGGYDSFKEAVGQMAKVREESYRPIEENQKVYKLIYDEYERLHDYFGRGANDVMRRLKRIMSEVSERGM